MQKDWIEVFTPTFRELYRISRVPDKGPKSLEVLSAFPGAEIRSIEEGGMLLPKKHTDLRGDLERLHNLCMNAIACSDELRFNLDIEIHLAIEDMSGKDTTGTIKNLLDRELEYFIRSEMGDAISQEDEHAWRTIAFRAGKGGLYHGEIDFLWNIVEAIARPVEKLSQKEIARRDEAIRGFYSGVEQVITNLEVPIRSKGFSRYRSAFES
jgi:hypothetical protein